jgi:hypothetical protein
MTPVRVAPLPAEHGMTTCVAACLRCFPLIGATPRAPALSTLARHPDLDA